MKKENITQGNVYKLVKSVDGKEKGTEVVLSGGLRMGNGAFVILLEKWICKVLFLYRQMK